MKLLKRVVLSVLALIALLVLTVVSLQTWYHLTPVPLSPEVKSLNERAAKLPTVTDNGYRLHGINAPRDQDALAYGRCVMGAQSAHRKAESDSGLRPPNPSRAENKAAYEVYLTERSKRSEQMIAACLKGGERLQLPKALNEARIQPGVRREALSEMAAATFDPLLLGRAEQIWAGEARRLGASFDAPIPLSTPLLNIERWRIAKAAVMWDSGDRAGAVNLWTQTIRNWVKSADDTLIDAMLSTAVISQVLIVMQQSAAQAPMLDEATVTAMQSALLPLEAMPHAIADSMLSEWQLQAHLAEWIKEHGTSAVSDLTATSPGVADRLSSFAYDANDTLNRLAKGNLWTQRTLLSVAGGSPPPRMPVDMISPGCGLLGENTTNLALLCLPFVRNPVGRVSAAISMPMYTDYGVRVADLMTLVNATRLTIAARRQGLTGNALAQFVSGAPADMRDVSTQKPFRYDTDGRKLHVELRTRSTVLGGKGEYSLPL